MNPLVQANSAVVLLSRALVTELVNATELSSPLVIAVPIVRTSVNVPGRLFTTPYWALAVAESARPANAAIASGAVRCFMRCPRYGLGSGVHRTSRIHGAK